MGLERCATVIKNPIAEYIEFHGTAFLERLTRKNLFQADCSSIFLLDKKGDESICRPDMLLLYQV